MRRPVTVVLLVIVAVLVGVMVAYAEIARFSGGVRTTRITIGPTDDEGEGEGEYPAGELRFESDHAGIVFAGDHSFIDFKADYAQLLFEGWLSGMTFEQTGFLWFQDGGYSLFCVDPWAEPSHYAMLAGTAHPDQMGLDGLTTDYGLITLSTGANFITCPTAFVSSGVFEDEGHPYDGVYLWGEDAESGGKSAMAHIGPTSKVDGQTVDAPIAQLAVFPPDSTGTAVPTASLTLQGDTAGTEGSIQLANKAGAGITIDAAGNIIVQLAYTPDKGMSTASSANTETISSYGGNTGTIQSSSYGANTATLETTSPALDPIPIPSIGFHSATPPSGPS